jgi:hypothetical protein
MSKRHENNAAKDRNREERRLHRRKRFYWNTCSYFRWNLHISHLPPPANQRQRLYLPHRELSYRQKGGSHLAPVLTHLKPLTRENEPQILQICDMKIFAPPTILLICRIISCLVWVQDNFCGKKFIWNFFNEQFFTMVIECLYRIKKSI